MCQSSAFYAKNSLSNELIQYEMCECDVVLRDDDEDDRVNVIKVLKPKGLWMSATRNRKFNSNNNNIVIKYESRHAHM